jgi:hypothetical protein
MIYPHEQIVNMNRIDFNESFRPQSLTRISESSSGIDIIDEESMETHSSDSEPLIIRYHSSSSSSPECSRRVIINSTDQTVTISNRSGRRRRRRNREKRWKNNSNEAKSISKNQSLHHRSSSEQLKHKDRLKRLFNEYSSEDIHREWKPLTFLESRELYEYAFDKHHKKSRSN